MEHMERYYFFIELSGIVDSNLPKTGCSAVFFVPNVGTV